MSPLGPPQGPLQVSHRHTSPGPLRPPLPWWRLLLSFLPLSHPDCGPGGLGWAGLASKFASVLCQGTTSGMAPTSLTFRSHLYNRGHSSPQFPGLREKVRPRAHTVNIPCGEVAIPGVTEGRGQPEGDLDCPCGELTTAPFLSLPLPRPFFPCPSQVLLALSLGWELAAPAPRSMLLSPSRDGKVEAQKARTCIPGCHRQSVHSLGLVSVTPLSGPAASLGPHRAFLGSSSQTLPVLAPGPTRTLPLTSCWTSSSYKQFWGPQLPALVPLSSPKEAPALPKLQSPGAVLSLAVSWPHAPP